MLTLRDMTKLGLYLEYNTVSKFPTLVIIYKIDDGSLIKQGYKKRVHEYYFFLLQGYRYEYIGPLESFSKLPDIYPEYLL